MGKADRRARKRENKYQGRAERGLPVAPPLFATSESPRYVGRGVAALAADQGRARWNQASVTAAQLAAAYGVVDVDGTRPDAWGDMVEG